MEITIKKHYTKKKKGLVGVPQSATTH